MFDHDCYEELDKKDSAWVWGITIIILSVILSGMFFGFLVVLVEDGNANNKTAQSSKSVDCEQRR